MVRNKRLSDRNVSLQSGAQAVSAPDDGALFRVRLYSRTVGLHNRVGGIERSADEKDCRYRWSGAKGWPCKMRIAKIDVWAGHVGLHSGHLYP